MCFIIEPNDLLFGLEVSREAKHRKIVIAGIKLFIH